MSGAKRTLPTNRPNHLDKPHHNGEGDTTVIRADLNGSRPHPDSAKDGESSPASPVPRSGGPHAAPFTYRKKRKADAIDIVESGASVDLVARYEERSNPVVAASLLKSIKGNDYSTPPPKPAIHSRVPPPRPGRGEKRESHLNGNGATIPLNLDDDETQSKEPSSSAYLEKTEVETKLVDVVSAWQNHMPYNLCNAIVVQESKHPLLHEGAKFNLVVCMKHDDDSSKDNSWIIRCKVTSVVCLITKEEYPSICKRMNVDGCSWYHADLAFVKSDFRFDDKASYGYYHLKTAKSTDEYSEFYMRAMPFMRMYFGREIKEDGTIGDIFLQRFSLPDVRVSKGIFGFDSVTSTWHYCTKPTESDSAVCLSNAGFGRVSVHIERTTRKEDDPPVLLEPEMRSGFAQYPNNISFFINKTPQEACVAAMRTYVAKLRRNDPSGTLESTEDDYAATFLSQQTEEVPPTQLN